MIYVAGNGIRSFKVRDFTIVQLQIVDCGLQIYSQLVAHSSQLFWPQRLLIANCLLSDSFLDWRIWPRIIKIVMIY